MARKSDLEREIVLTLLKDISIDYNAGNIAKVLKKTRVGTFKALKSLEKKGIVKGKTLGKATFYTLNLGDEYARKTAELYLIEESKKKQRWLEEFSELFKYTKTAILFGSILRSEERANDIDLLLVFEQKNNHKINKFIEEKNQILAKKIHVVKQTEENFINNLNKNDKVMLSALKDGVILCGFEEFMGLMENVRSKK